MSGIDYDPVAEFYDVYASSDFDVPFFLAETHAVRGPVLELMAGTGRLSLPLARAGVELVCVDRSEGMLARIRKKIAGTALAVRVVRADVRDLDLPDRFALAILPFHSFSELVAEEDRRRALRAVRRHLHPGGRFVVTLHEPESRLRAVDGNRREVGRFPFGDGVLAVSGVETGDARCVERRQLIECYDASGELLWRRGQQMRFALPGREEVERLADETGFGIEAIWGEYDRSPHVPGESRFLILALRREDEVEA